MAIGEPQGGPAFLIPQGKSRPLPDTTLHPRQRDSVSLTGVPSTLVGRPGLQIIRSKVFVRRSKGVWSGVGTPWAQRLIGGIKIACSSVPPDVPLFAVLNRRCGLFFG